LTTGAARGKSAYDTQDAGSISVQAGESEEGDGGSVLIQSGATGSVDHCKIDAVLCLYHLQQLI
jgi:hypothetical protein